MNNFKVEILKHPTSEDWKWVKTCTLNTGGKKTVSDASDEWKVKLLRSEHSPIRELKFGIRMEIPYYVSVHFVRHKIGVEHFVSTQRTDRTNEDRNAKTQDAMVTHIMSVNAQELIFMAHRRLCNQADPTTRKVMEEIVRQVLMTNPEFKEFLVPMCEYLHTCNEFYPCGRDNNIEIKER